MSGHIRPPMGNSLSPEPCALIPLLQSPIHDRNWYARAEVMDGGFAARAGGR